MSFCHLISHGKVFDLQEEQILFYKNHNMTDETIDNQEEQSKEHAIEEKAIENQEKKKKKKFSLSMKDENKQKIEELEIKLAENNDKFLRLYSEFDNYRKRTMKERLDMLKSASTEMITVMLTILDDFERSIKAAENTTDINSIIEGNILIYNKFQNILKQKGLEEINALGEAFDTDFHEAITNITAPTEEDKGKVLDVTEKGYMLNGKVIRFSKVVIGS